MVDNGLKNEMTEKPETEAQAISEAAQFRGVEFKTTDEARQYSLWKKEAPAYLRHIVESALIGKKAEISKEFTPLLREFLSSMQTLLTNPAQGIDLTDADIRVKNMLKKLQSVNVSSVAASKSPGSINVFEILKNPDIGFAQKLQWYKAQIAPRIEWLLTQEKIEQDEKETEKTELAPPNEEDELKPSMDEMEKNEEGPSSGFYEINPYYGGYYRGHVYDKWDHSTLSWKKDQKTLTEKNIKPDQFAEGTLRKLRGKFKLNKVQTIDMPYNFGINAQSVAANAGVDIRIFQDNNGVWYAKAVKTAAESEETAADIGNHVELDFEIGRLKSPVASEKTADENLKAESATTQLLVKASLPPDVLQKISDSQKSNLPNISKARLLCRFVKENLEYSNDSSCNALYRAVPGQYFNAMWTNKKADCDVANTFAAEVLRQADIKVRLIAGHYIKSPDKKGSAVLHGGTGHAWIEVFDEDDKKWVRMDATPKGDPNLDEEEQEKDLDENTPNEGDYGENEAEIMSDEELKELMEKLEKAEEEAEKQKLEAMKTPEHKYAEEAGCSLEEAKSVLNKIKKLRELKDAKGRNLLGESKAVWLEAMRQNAKEKIYYTGPVKMSEGTDLENPVETWIDVLAGEDNPSGFEKPAKRIEIEKYFGGFEVYIAADMSGSMTETDPNTHLSKSESQRDCVFLFVDSIMSNAANVKKNQRNLKSPMPVRVCVSVFGANTEIVLPITDTWGPKEQITLYRALNKCAGGGTPDHQALLMMKSIIDEKKSLKEKTEQNMHRFVAVFADGGSDHAGAVRNIVKEMREEGTVVYGFGITKSGREMEAVYAPDAKTIEDTSKLAETGIKVFIQQLVKIFEKEHL